MIWICISVSDVDFCCETMYHVILDSQGLDSQNHVGPQLEDTKPAVQAIRVATETTNHMAAIFEVCCSCVNKIN